MAQATLEIVNNHLYRPDVSKDTVRDTVLSLKARYDEPQRHYHNFEHPLELFDILGAHIEVVQDPEVVGWAIMYHDAIYDPTAPGGTNEELSAQLAEQELPTTIGTTKAARVASFTRATAEHDIGENDPDLDFFLDADLVILGSSPERYRRYAADIRREYAHVPEEHYIPARIRILEGLVNRVEEAGLFRTQLFRGLYEERAQQNVAEEAEKLRQAN